MMKSGHYQDTIILYAQLHIHIYVHNIILYIHSNIIIHTFMQIHNMYIALYAPEF